MSGPLRVGIVGCGNVSLGFHLPAYLPYPDRFQLAGLADPTPDRLELGRVAGRLEIADVHRDAAELLARSDIDQTTTPDPAAARPAEHVDQQCEPWLGKGTADDDAGPGGSPAITLWGCTTMLVAPCPEPEAYGRCGKICAPKRCRLIEAPDSDAAQSLSRRTA